MRIALYQCSSGPLDVAGNLGRLRSQAHSAAERQVQLLVTPEMFLTGYNIGHAHVRQLAQPRDGSMAQQVGALAREFGVAIIYGYPECDDQGQLFNSVQCIDSQGNARGNYRKSHLFGELDRSMFAPGDDAWPIIELNGWRLGMLICYDLEFPENVRRVALAGADLIVVPTANMLPYEFIADVTVRSRAFENQCVVAYANYCGHEGAIEYCGLSSVVAADGKPLAQAHHSESLIIATLDRDALVASRQAFPYLRDRRAELYTELANNTSN